MEFVPFYDKVVIRPMTRKGPIDTGETKFEEMGEVLAVGESVTFLEVGDTVFFRPFGYAKTAKISSQPGDSGEPVYVVQVGPEFILGKIPNHAPRE